ncbi:hypothetical protein EDD17DRAFT_1506925 [Pisolithus thermaeus]|nr:hypothetical protein EDD17DRAFT_1506925 [Pisolithus thermaeus]
MLCAVCVHVCGATGVQDAHPTPRASQSCDQHATCSGTGVLDALHTCTWCMGVLDAHNMCMWCTGVQDAHLTTRASWSCDQRATCGSMGILDAHTTHWESGHVTKRYPVPHGHPGCPPKYTGILVM